MSGLMRGPVARITAVSLGSNIVDGIRVAAFAVLAAEYADSVWQVGLVATVATLPQVFLAIPIGVLLDRWSKLRTLVVVNLARAVMLAGLAAALYLGAGSILLLCGFAFVFGILEEFYDSASVLIVPDLTQPNEYLKSNAVIRWVQELGNGAIGPVVGAFLVGWSTTSPFTLSAAILLIVALALRSLNRSHVLLSEQSPTEQQAEPNDAENPPDGETAAQPSQVKASLGERTRAFFQELWAGIVVAWRNRFARSLVVVFGLWNLFGWMPESILIVYVLEALGSDASGYGLLLAVTSVGTLLGGLLLLVTPDKVSVRRVATIALAIYATTIAMPGIWPQFWVAAVAFFIQGLPMVLLSGTVSAQLQLTIERGFHGRVYAVTGTIGSLCMTAGLFLGGVIAEFTSTPFVFILGGAGIGAAAVVAAATFTPTLANIKDE